MPNAIDLYRIARWLYLRRVPIIPKLIQMIIFIIYNCHISYKAEIGKNTYCLHKGMATLILEGVKIGCNSRIGMNVLITGKGPYKNVPQIGNKVWIGPGAVISGPVIIGDNVIIAPNSSIIKSVPDGAIVGGVPSKIIGWTKELNYDIFANECWNENYMDYLTQK